MNKLPKLSDALGVYILVIVYVISSGLIFSDVSAFWFPFVFPFGLAIIPLGYSLVFGFDFRITFLVKSPRRQEILGGILLIAGVFILLAFLDSYVEWMSPQKQTNQLIQEKLILGPLWYGLAVMVLFPAVFEELLCRGFLLSGLREHFGKWISIGICSLLFSLLHFDLVRLPFSFFAGIALSYTAWETGSIFIPIILHGLFNFILFFILKITVNIPEMIQIGWLEIFGNPLFWVILVCGSFFALMCIISGTKIMKKINGVP